MKCLFICMFAVVAACMAYPPGVIFRPYMCSSEGQCFPMQTSWNPFGSMYNPMVCPMHMPYFHPMTRRILLTIHPRGSNTTESCNATAVESAEPSATPITTETDEHITEITIEGEPAAIPSSTPEPENSIENMISKDDKVHSFVPSNQTNTDKEPETKPATTTAA